MLENAFEIAQCAEQSMKHNDWFSFAFLNIAESSFFDDGHLHDGHWLLQVLKNKEFEPWVYTENAACEQRDVNSAVWIVYNSQNEPPLLPTFRKPNKS